MATTTISQPVLERFQKLRDNWKAKTIVPEKRSAPFINCCAFAPVALVLLRKPRRSNAVPH
jgi:hypothetical protein